MTSELDLVSSRAQKTCAYLYSETSPNSPIHEEILLDLEAIWAGVVLNGPVTGLVVAFPHAPSAPPRLASSRPVTSRHVFDGACIFLAVTCVELWHVKNAVLVAVPRRLLALPRFRHNQLLLHTQIMSRWILQYNVSLRTQPLWQYTYTHISSTFNKPFNTCSLCAKIMTFD